MRRTLSAAAGLACLASGLLFASAGHAFEAFVSMQPDRGGAVALQGATLAGDVYIFVAPETGASRVEFFIDDPATTGAPDKVENGAPWDLAGTAVGGLALPYDTRNLTDDLHDLTVLVTTTSGTVETFTATFTVANSLPALSFSPNDFVITAEAGGPDVVLQTTLSTSDGSDTDFTLSTLMPWLSVEPAGGSTLPADITITASPEGLAVGTYAGAIQATSDGYTWATLSVTMAVTNPNSPSGFALWISESPDRAAPALLHGATLRGAAYIFTLPEAGVKKVDFFIDNPTLSGSPVRTEKGGPFDLAGTAADGQAIAFDTNTLVDGAHSISARVTAGSSVEVVHANFTVGNDVQLGTLTATPTSLSLSGISGGATASGAVDVGTTGTPGAGFSATTSTPWLSVSPGSGTTPASATVTADPALLGPGTHSGSVTFLAPGYASIEVPVSFEVAGSGNSLQAGPGTLAFTANAGGSPQTAPVDITALDGATVAFNASDDQPWLSVAPTSGETPGPLAVTVNPGALSAGTYSGTVTVTAAGYDPVTVNVELTVEDSAPAGQALWVSGSPDRGSPALLEGATLSGSAYIFTLPETGVTKVQFFIDNPTLSGSPVQTEKGAPFDLAGTAANGQAIAFDTNTLADGAHSISARITVGSSVQVVHANFTVANDAVLGTLLATPTTLSLAGASGEAPVTTSLDLDATGASGAGFSASSSAGWLSVSPESGTTPVSVTVTANPGALGPGTHSGTLTFSAPGYTSAHVPVTFEVAGSGKSLVASQGTLVFTANAGGSSETSLVGITASDGATVAFTAGADQPWLTVAPSSGETPEQLTVTADPGALLAGSYSGAVTVTAPGYDPVSIAVDLTVGDSGACVPVACELIKVEKPYVLDFSEDHGFLADSAGNGTGFTYLAWPSAGNGYLPANLALNPVDTTLELTTTAGIAFQAINSQDNMIGVGIDGASHNSLISTEIVNVPAASGNFEQAGLWFGVDEDNYSKLVVVLLPSGPAVQHQIEVGGIRLDEVTKPVAGLVGSDIVLQLIASPTTREVAAQYSVNGGDFQVLSVFPAPPEFFSFDAAGIDPTIGTRTFTGIFATHRNGPAPVVFAFDEFSVVDGAEIPREDTIVFDRASHSLPMPTSLAWGPDDKLYVTQMFGQIHALTYDDNLNVINDEVITALNDSIGDRLTLGITVDPISTPGNVVLWVAHSSPSVNNGTPNSSTVTRLSGPGFSQVEHVITGLPRAIANHAINSLHFGPDGRLYIALGGNTGAGAPNDSGSEFGDMQEQPLSAAILVADVYNPSFDGSCHNAQDIFGPPPCDVVPYATGFRNSYDFVFHSNGQLYATDNGLGVAGTFPPSPTAPCLGFADPALWTAGGHNPGTQPDLLHVVIEGAYYGHPNPHRDECVFKDGSYQGVSPLPNYMPPILNLGNNRSSNGVIEYTSAARACGKLDGDLIVANYSVGDDLTRVKLSEDGLSVVSSESMVGGFKDPLPLATNADGVIYVGELGGNRVTALRPASAGCWTDEPPLPQPRLDAGAASIGTSIYLVGGKSGNTYFPTLFAFDTLTDTWVQAAGAPQLAVENPAVTSLNGRLYVFGGSTQAFSDAVASASVYDPATNGWSSLAPMPTPRGGAAAAAIQGLIYVVGGMTTDGASTNIVEVYNPQTNAWTSGVPMSTRRDNLGVTALNGKLYAIGGRIRNADGTTLDGTLSSVEAFDPVIGAWQPAASMPTGRRAFALGTVGGKIQIFGGEDSPTGDGVFEAGEEYDPAADTWQVISPMTLGRHGPASATVADRVYVMGGAPQSGAGATTAHQSFAH